MRIFEKLRLSEHTLTRRLIRYMLILVAVILAALLSALSLFGGFRSDRKNLIETLSLQLDFMESDLVSHSEVLATIGVELSNTAVSLVDEVLEENGLTFDQLEGNAPVLGQLQKALISPLREFLLRSDSSGAFLSLNASVYPRHQPGSNCGLYLQRNGPSPSEASLLLYRGKPDVGKALGIMPHRKWRLEFQTNLFSHFDPDSLSEKLPAEWAYTYTPVLSLPGTSEQALLLQVPIRADDGTLYGVCGFELNQSFFKAYHPQPSRLNHLSFFVYTQSEGADIPENRLAAGTTDGFFSNPTGALKQTPLGEPLSIYESEHRSYVGLSRKLDMGPNNPFATLAVLIPMEEYNHILHSSLLQAVLLTLVLMAFAVFCCALFSQRFLLPILHTLEQVKSGTPAYSSGFREIDDLLIFLAEQDERHQDAVRTLEDGMRDAQSRAALIRQEYDQVCTEYRSAQKEVSRLADIQLSGVDSETYQEFLSGIQELTPTETTIFHYYLEGKTVKEIMAITQTKESTLRYHNHNIYGKLGVRSLKQLLQFATIMQTQEQNKPR